MLSVSTQIAREDDLDQFTRMLDSAAFADEIVIFNLERTDEPTQKLFKQSHARVVSAKTPPVIEAIRNKQIQAASHDWVLILDFDEIVTPALANEIKRAITGPAAAYALKRRNFSLGRQLRYGGWGDDYVARLFHKSVFVNWPTNIHSTPVIKGEYHKLTHYLEHHKDASLAQMVAKTNRYSDVEAKLFLDGHLPPVTAFTLLRKTSMEFLRRYFFKLGLLDGPIGLLQSLYQAYSVFITYAKLYELQQHTKPQKTGDK